jgi:hypothetical protein
VGFLAAIWYWHFVDVVWLILFALVYIWGTANILDIWDSINSISIDLSSRWLNWLWTPWWGVKLTQRSTIVLC